MKVISEMIHDHYIRYLRCYYYQWVYSSTGELVVHEGIFRPLISGFIPLQVS